MHRDVADKDAYAKLSSSSGAQRRQAIAHTGYPTIDAIRWIHTWNPLHEQIDCVSVRHVKTKAGKTTQFLCLVKWQKATRQPQQQQSSQSASI